MFCMIDIDPFEKEHAILATLPIFQPKYTNFFQSSLKGRNVEYLKRSPLSQFKEKLCDLGAHFHGFGKELVKGANLAFRTIFLQEKQLNELDFKINHVFRTALQQKVDELKSLDRHVVKALLDRSESFGENIQIEQNVPFPIGDSTFGFSTKITMEGLGSLFICTSPEFPSIYNRIVVQMESGKNIGHFHALLAFLNLDKAFQQSTEEDQERHKIGHLFRTFYPRQAFKLERSELFFSLPTEEIKAKIIEEVPEMATIFEIYLDQMTLEEILPGRMRYRINGLAQRAYDLGARGLTSALTGASGKELYERTASILTSGLLSSETRKFLQCSAIGLSTIADYYSGGSDVIFTQMITEDNCSKNVDLNKLNYYSDVRFIISLEAIETGTYQYLNDAYGNRSTDPNAYWGTPYKERPGILEFIDTLQTSTLLSCRRERLVRNEDDLGAQWEIIERDILRALSEEHRFLEELGITHFNDQNRMLIFGLSLPEFLDLIKQWFFGTIHPDILYRGHEVMVKERIAPKFIQKILVPNQEVREELICHLKECNLIQDNQILGHLVDDFIIVENKASAALLT